VQHVVETLAEVRASNMVDVADVIAANLLRLARDA
jgi:hypothetical protein